MKVYENTTTNRGKVRKQLKGIVKNILSLLPLYKGVENKPLEIEK